MVTLEFNEFVLEDNHDTLAISDPSGGGINEVYHGTRTAFTVGPEYTSITLHLQTNNENTYKGFALDFVVVNGK